MTSGDAPVLTGRDLNRALLARQFLIEPPGSRYRACWS